jgi:hypothetical protein
MNTQYINPPKTWGNNFSNYNDLYSPEIMDMLNYFNPIKNIDSPLNYEKIYLSNYDFKYGTYRITQPGYYILTEDIVFHPNESNDFFPEKSQEDIYPTKNGPYVLGFFAAISIETDGVVLDLNNKSIRQSKEFYLKQRFFSLIELASSPFIPGQGPANFGDSISYSSNVMIKNGSFGLTSHYGIHGNGQHRVILEKSLNGSEVLLGRNLNLCYSSEDVNVLSTYTASRFVLRFLYKLKELENTATFRDKSIEDIIYNLEYEMKNVENAIIYNKPLPDTIFTNKFGISDCNMYGILFNPLGVAVNQLRENRDGAIGNENICVHDVKIQNIKCNPHEIRGINSLSNGVYEPVQIGPVGEVIRIDSITGNDGVYEGDVLSDAEFIISKYMPKFRQIGGKTNISDDLLNWAESESDINLLFKMNEK